MELFVPFTLATWLIALNHEPANDRVVLLPSADGRAGAVQLSTAKGELLLAQPYAAAEASSDGKLTGSTADGASVQARYGDTLAALPARPVSFTVYYLSGSAEALTAESAGQLDALKAELLRRPVPEIVVVGHTDRVGSQADNDVLSLARAGMVRQRLLDSGVKAQSMEIAGRGERELAVDTADEVAESRNRRVEIIVR
ncbi:hypothetical protein GCM10007907_31850 [Chitinimonas prasina]|uniref:OmpA-like domain-containing protein n=1 Tax=Chitinimonas prasina TaxID=1434937 RepID=A0ABQ5YLZ8_9NEIS|nr:OmpA family protein [Chitinimonas prasina]GLR14395.1 hypothetical protein GCM10007907_31850 [Chitinimonas prasina]